MRAMSDRESTLQARLIPVNIIVCILCLVAAVSLLVAPLVTFNASNLVTTARYGGEYTIADEAYYDRVTYSGAKVTLTATDILSVSSSDNAADELIRVTLAESGVIDKIGSDVAFTKIVETLGYSFDGQIETRRYNAILNAFKGIGTAITLADVDKVVEGVVEVYSADFGEPSNIEEVSRWASNAFERASNSVSAPRTVDWEAISCVIISESFNFDKPLVDYVGVAHAMLGGGAEGTLDNVLTVKTDTIKIVFTVIWIVVLLSVIGWVTLFLFALVHLMLSNRRFSMWYVKILGAIPCILFGIVPLVLPSLGLSLGGAVGLVCKVISGASSWTFISGGCYILLWLVSIFWAFPIKRKIKREQFS